MNCAGTWPKRSGRWPNPMTFVSLIVCQRPAQARSCADCCAILLPEHKRSVTLLLWKITQLSPDFARKRNRNRKDEGRQKTGVRRQETGDRRQETGDRRQETGDRSQKSEVRSQKSEV